MKGFGEKESSEVRTKTFESVRQGSFAELTPEANSSLISDFIPRAVLEKMEDQHKEKVEAAEKAGAEARKDLRFSVANAERIAENKGKAVFFDSGRFLSDEKAKAEKTAIKIRGQLETASCDNCSLCIVVCSHGCVALSLVDF